MNALIPVLAALAAWASALVLDWGQYLVHIRAARAGTTPTWYWGALPLTLIFAAVLLASIWAIAFRPGSPKWVGLLVVAVISLLLLVGLPFVATGLAPFEAMFRRPLVRSELLLREAAPTSFLMVQTSAIFLSGPVALLRRAKA
jgi:hypothetical protein